MKTGSVAALLTGLLLSPGAAVALEKDYGWFGSVKFGALVTTGNTETSSIHSSLKERYRGKQWHHEVQLELLRGRDNGEVNASRYLGDYKLIYKHLPQNEIFLDLRAVRDRFAGFERQYFETIGYGHTLVEGLNDELTTEAGVGLSQQTAFDGRRRQDSVLRLGARYQHLFPSGNEFNTRLLALIAEENTNLNLFAALKARLLGSLSMEVSLTATHDSKAPPDKEKTDLTTAVGLVYDF